MTIPTHTYSNPNFSGSNQAVNSPQINLPYIWDESLNVAQGAWRANVTGDPVNIYTSQGQSINTRNLNYATDSTEVTQFNHDNLKANANIQVGNVDVSSSNVVPVSNHASVVTYSQTLTANGSSLARNLHTGYVAPITKHGYIFRLTGTSVNTSITIKVAVCSDNVTFAPFDERTISWDATIANDSVRVSTYFGEFNFKYAKIQVEMTDCTCYIQETHTS
jgi:hypothetical protein